jgi:hypothetical protein
VATVKTDKITWDLSITVFHVKMLRELETPVILTDPNVLASYMEDSVKLYELLWILLEKQAATNSVDEMQFAMLFTEHYDDFVRAFVGSLSDFFRKSKRIDLSALIENILSASTKMLANAEKNLSSGTLGEITDKIVANQEAETQATLQKILTNLSGDSPGSSE